MNEQQILTATSVRRSQYRQREFDILLRDLLGRLRAGVRIPVRHATAQHKYRPRGGPRIVHDKFSLNTTQGDLSVDHQLKLVAQHNMTLETNRVEKAHFALQMSKPLPVADIQDDTLYEICQARSRVIFRRCKGRSRPAENFLSRLVEQECKQVGLALIMMIQTRYRKTGARCNPSNARAMIAELDEGR